MQPFPCNDFVDTKFSLLLMVMVMMMMIVCYRCCSCCRCFYYFYQCQCFFRVCVRSCVPYGLFWPFEPFWFCNWQKNVHSKLKMAMNGQFGWPKFWFPLAFPIAQLNLRFIHFSVHWTEYYFPILLNDSNFH